jgi:hypothetical protein
MPYTLDLIRHRDQFRRRGLKPVHNPIEQPRVHEDDEQYPAEEEEGEVDKDEIYISPKDNQERPSKRRRILQDRTAEENKTSFDEGAEIRLRAGRKGFMDPRQFDTNPKGKDAQPVTRHKEVSFIFWGI